MSMLDLHLCQLNFGLLLPIGLRAEVVNYYGMETADWIAGASARTEA